MHLTLLHSTEDLYQDLLVEHEKALQIIKSLRSTIKEHQNSLTIPDQLMESVVIKGDVYIRSRYLDISSIEAINGGVSVKLNDMTSSFLWSSLKKYQEQLPSLYFKRISKSCIINVANLARRIDRNAQMKNGDTFIISDSYKNYI